MQNTETRSLIFKAIKHKYIEDDDGEATLILKVSMEDKLSAFAIPAKELLSVTIVRSEEDG